MNENRQFKKAMNEAMHLNNESFPDRMNASLGLEVKNFSRKGKHAEIDYEYTRKEQQLNPYGGVHGGIVCTVFDTAIGIGADALSGHLVTTTDLSTSFLRALNGETYKIHVEYTHIGGRLISGIGYMYDKESGELCATCMATYMIIQGKGRGIRV